MVPRGKYLKSFEPTTLPLSACFLRRGKGQVESRDCLLAAHRREEDNYPRCSAVCNLLYSRYIHNTKQWIQYYRDSGLPWFLKGIEPTIVEIEWHLSSASYIREECFEPRSMESREAFSSDWLFLGLWQVAWSKFPISYEGSFVLAFPLQPINAARRWSLSICSFPFFQFQFWPYKHCFHT